MIPLSFICAPYTVICINFLFILYNAIDTLDTVYLFVSFYDARSKTRLLQILLWSPLWVRMCWCVCAWWEMHLNRDFLLSQESQSRSYWSLWIRTANVWIAMPYVTCVEKETFVNIKFRQMPICTINSLWRCEENLRRA